MPALCGEGIESQYSAPKDARTMHMEERKVMRNVLKFCIAASKHSLLQYGRRGGTHTSAAKNDRMRLKSKMEKSRMVV